MAKATEAAVLQDSDLILHADAASLISLAERMIDGGALAQAVMDGSRRLRAEAGTVQAQQRMAAEAGSLADLLREVVRVGFALRNAMAVHYPEE